MTSGNDIQHVMSAGKRRFWLVRNDGAIINEAFRESLGVLSCRRVNMSVCKQALQAVVDA
jgi:hypothetical protein